MVALLDSIRYDVSAGGVTAIPTRFGYDAVEDKKRRQAPTGILRDEETELLPERRRKLISSTRDLSRNFSIAAWAIRKHLDYVATHNFQSRNGNPKLDKRIEELVRWYSRAPNCDVAGRHRLDRMIRISEACRTKDGDVFHMKLSDGRLEAIEGDRIRNPLQSGLDWQGFKHGVKLDKAGKALAYAVCRRTDFGGFAFERTVPGTRLLQHGYFDRFDQVRGVTPLSTAINNFRDVYESFDYALMKAKVAQLFGLAIYQEGAEIDETEPDLSRPFLLRLRDTDRAEFLENKTPSIEFKEFMLTVIAAALKSLDIPMSFYYENFSNYSGSRQALLQYEQSAEQKRKDVRELLDKIIAWRMVLFILDGYLELPGKMTLADLRWEWIPVGLPWINPLQEVNADIAALGARLTSRQRIAKRQGQDWMEIDRELKQEDAIIAATQSPLDSESEDLDGGDGDSADDQTDQANEEVTANA